MLMNKMGSENYIALCYYLLHLLNFVLHFSKKKHIAYTQTCCNNTQRSRNSFASI